MAGHKFSVVDGELMCYIPNGEGDSEIITFDTCHRMLFLFKLVIEHARANREQ